MVRRFNGTVEEGMVSEVNGVRIELPWMLVDKERLLWVRAQTGIQYTLNHLRPMMLNINGVRRTDVDIYSIITDQHVSGGPPRKQRVHQFTRWPSVLQQETDLLLKGGIAVVALT